MQTRALEKSNKTDKTDFRVENYNETAVGRLNEKKKKKRKKKKTENGKE